MTCEHMTLREGSEVSGGDPRVKQQTVAGLVRAFKMDKGVREGRPAWAQAPHRLTPCPRSLQLCEDLFSRINDTTNDNMSYSVEVGHPARAPVPGLWPRAPFLMESVSPPLACALCSSLFMRVTVIPAPSAQPRWKEQPQSCPARATLWPRRPQGDCAGRAPRMAVAGGSGLTPPALTLTQVPASPSHCPAPTLPPSLESP